ncbi:Methyltransferase domain-containing protein [Desulfotomaculum arcticum]|uniref:Methyltransferase domain-containing protein n=1 Tax=Desulfotruncus arcticus DSM 17038 TaxID=1121424 RepID=A0A1I2VL13_9FIRM|nr:class I SAM-dependent methyltransferase [Desulfotruncus arcticus]SFG89773.1 Methyltransferase domain-containing protein [Desulfotomaculum arcticum] [Desulfotruncus arcticus DSM 17038]
MKKEQCRLCGGYQLEYIFSHLILKKYNVKYYICNNCQLLQTEKPYWLEEAYVSSISTSLDTGIMSRNINLCKISSAFIYFLLPKDEKFIDYGGGYGIFTRLMRDVGYDFYSYDKYNKSLFAKGFEAVSCQEYVGATAFEVFEHLDNPNETLDDIFSYLQNKNVLFSTVLYGNWPPNPDDWWYYVFDTGQHIAFYNIKTLRWIAEKYNLNLWSNGRSLHYLSENKISTWKLNALSRINKVLFPYITRVMPSKTTEDHNTLHNLNSTIQD